MASKVYDAVKGSIVRVRASGDALENDEYLQRAVGSGVVVVDRGTILTSLHVVAGAGRIRVVFADGLESDARIVSSRRTISPSSRLTQYPTTWRPLRFVRAPTCSRGARGCGRVPSASGRR